MSCSFQENLFNWTEEEWAKFTMIRDIAAGEIFDLVLATNVDPDWDYLDYTLKPDGVESVLNNFSGSGTSVNTLRSIKGLGSNDWTTCARSSLIAWLTL